MAIASPARTGKRPYNRRLGARRPGPPTDRLRRLLFRLEELGDQHPGVELRDLLRELGHGKIPSDEVLMRNLNKQLGAGTNGTLG